MQGLNPLEVGVMFWAGGDPTQTLAEWKSMGFRCGQLGIPGDLDLSCAAHWRDAAAEAEFSIYTVVAAYNGESYADVATVQRTVGFIPRETRREREARTMAISDFAAVLKAGGIATHIGFVPEDSGDDDAIAVREMVRRICDRAAGNGQTFALETGQERADTLLEFLHTVNRPNLGVNFDPANMILYGTGDPIQALGLLASHVLTVHAKDGDWPAKNKPGSLGEERALGAGAVDLRRFVQVLKRAGYRGPLAVERESSDPAQRRKDIEAGAMLMRKIVSSFN